MRNRILIALLALVVLALPLIAADKTLTNEDIVQLWKMGLGEDVVVAKIRQAADVDFKLETDDLAKLKSAGVPGKVIAAMLDRSTAVHNGAGGVVAVAGGMGQVNVVSAPEAFIKLAQSDGKTIPMTSLVGDSSSTYAYVTMLFWLNFPGLHAAIRTHDKNPAFLINSEQEPRSRFYIVRVDVNDRGGDRSLKMGKSGMFAFRAGTAPDADWTFAYDSAEEHRGLWRISLKKPLPAGEYGVFVAQRAELFDFGVD